MRKILFIILIFASLENYSQKEYQLLARRHDTIFLYNTGNQIFHMILKLKSDYMNECVYHRSNDSLFIFQENYKYNDSTNTCYKYSINVNKKKGFFVKEIALTRIQSLRTIKKQKITNRDTIIYLTNKPSKYYTYSRANNGYIIYSQEEDLYIMGSNQKKKIINHYSGNSKYNSYLRQGYIFPEMSLDGKYIYCVDTYIYKHDGKKRFVNKFIDNHRKKIYSYIILFYIDSKDIVSKVKVPFIDTYTLYSRNYRNLQLSNDDKYLLFETNCDENFIPQSYLLNTKTSKIIELPKGYRFIYWLE